jgi:hypothetical protein
VPRRAALCRPMPVPAPCPHRGVVPPWRTPSASPLLPAAPPAPATRVSTAPPGALARSGSSRRDSSPTIARRSRPPPRRGARFAPHPPGIVRPSGSRRETRPRLW